MLSSSSKTLPITTPSGYIIALLAGRPASETWDICMRELTGKMIMARDALNFVDKEAKHRRGAYPSVNTGISYGGGAKVCPAVRPSSVFLMTATGSWGAQGRIQKERDGDGGSQTMPAIQGSLWVHQQ